MKKRIVSAVMALILCLTLLPTAALAADGAWDGSIATAFAGGSGTENDPYQIDDGAQLAYLASEVNKGQPYENSYFVLTADIDLANHDWTPIGNSSIEKLISGWVASHAEVNLAKRYLEVTLTNIFQDIDMLPTVNYNVNALPMRRIGQH